MFALSSGNTKTVPLGTDAMTQENLHGKYCPARIYQSTASNKGHIRQPSFSDQQLGKPPIPDKPELVQFQYWTKERSDYAVWSFILFVILLLFPLTTVFAIFGLIGFVVWALPSELSKHEKINKEANENYRKKLEQYEIELMEYNKVLLPGWENNRSDILKRKIEDWKKVAIKEACRQKSWKINSKKDIEESRTKGYIGKGEDHLVNALLEAHGIYTRPQVTIERYYTADIVCLNLETGKLCVVEVDGSHHWLQSEQIEKDNRRMESLAAKGVPTIRFINHVAADSPYECVKHIQTLLS